MILARSLMQLSSQSGSVEEETASLDIDTLQQSGMLSQVQPGKNTIKPRRRSRMRDQRQAAENAAAAHYNRT